MSANVSEYPFAEGHSERLRCRDGNGPQPRNGFASLVLSIDQWRKSTNLRQDFAKLDRHLMKDIGLTRAEIHCGVLMPRLLE